MADKYTYAVGRRKTSVATVRLFEGKGDNKFNDKKFSDIYVGEVYSKMLNKPFVIADLDPKSYYLTIVVKGGGINSQLEAAIHGISRALVKLKPEVKTSLKKQGLMTRDSRMVERKKAGFRKARKKEQFSKR